MVERFLQYLQYEKNYSSHTVLSYKNDLSQFDVFLKANDDSVDFLNLNSDHIRQWVVQLAEGGMSARSINRKVSALKSFYKFLMRDGFVRKSPVKNIVLPKTNKPLPLFFKEKEVAAVLSEVITGSSFEDCRNRLIIDLFYETGIRVSELINIKDVDIDRYKSTLRVLGKRNKERQIPIGKNIQEALDEYIEMRAKEVVALDGYLFLRKNGQKMYSRLVYGIVRKHMSQVSSLTKRSPHVLRHTFASALLNNGADINAVKELLGHSNLAATEVYTHTSFDLLQKIYKQAHPRA